VHSVGISLVSLFLTVAVVISQDTVPLAPGHAAAARVVPLFTEDARVRPHITDPLGLKRTVPSFWATFACYGVLAAVAVPVATSACIFAHRCNKGHTHGVGPCARAEHGRGTATSRNGGSHGCRPSQSALPPGHALTF
jgi:hypothetical protein